MGQEKLQYETVGRGFHQGGVTFMDMSIQRPILVTFSKDDCTIRFWNIVSGLCVLSRKYHVSAATAQALDP